MNSEKIFFKGTDAWLVTIETEQLFEDLYRTKSIKKLISVSTGMDFEKIPAPAVTKVF